MISSYYWANIKQDVANYVSYCDKCQRAHTSHLEKVNQTLHSIQIPIKTMLMISIDLLKLKEYKEYNYVITAVYYFTKYVEMGCLKQKCTKEVTKWIFDNIFCRYRVCDVHITDNGTEFMNHTYSKGSL